MGVLKGAVMVMADLARRLDPLVTMDWMAVSSYGAGTKSSGVVRILKDLDADLSGRHVLIVEDIIDTGITLSWLLGNLRSRGDPAVEGHPHQRSPHRVLAHPEVDLPSARLGGALPRLELEGCTGVTREIGGSGDA